MEPHGQNPWYQLKRPVGANIPNQKTNLPTGTSSFRSPACPVPYGTGPAGRRVSAKEESSWFPYTGSAFSVIASDPDLIGRAWRSIGKRIEIAAVAGAPSQ